MSPLLPLAISLLWGWFGGGGHSDCAETSATAERTMEVIEQQWPLRSSADPVSSYVQDLGTRLAAHTRMSVTPRFFVVRNLDPMAFALGGGRFVVSDGLVALVRDEAQLAAVLAHELSHQTLGHFCGASHGLGQRVRLGGVVQHLDLGLEIEADLKARNVLAASGFDSGSMVSVLKCLLASGYGGEQLRERIRVLSSDGTGETRSRWNSERFESTRDLLDQEIGELDSLLRRCR